MNKKIKKALIYTSIIIVSVSLFFGGYVFYKSPHKLNISDKDIVKIIYVTPIDLKTDIVGDELITYEIASLNYAAFMEEFNQLKYKKIEKHSSKPVYLEITYKSGEKITFYSYRMIITKTDGSEVVHYRHIEGNIEDIIKKYI